MVYMKRRVVITGLGLVSPVGNDVESSWTALVNGQSGVGPITRFDATEYSTRFAAEVTDFDPADHLEKKEVRRNDPFVWRAHLALRIVSSGCARRQGPRARATRDRWVIWQGTHMCRTCT